MLRLRKWQGAAVVLACCGLLVPQTSAVADAPVAANPAPQQKTTQKAADVALTEGGLLVGAAFTPDGKQLDGATIVITQGQNEIVRTNTDRSGAFAIAQLKPGTYQIGISDKVAPIRVWTPESAPPKAKHKAILVTGEIIRGQGDYYEDYGDYGGGGGGGGDYYEYCPDGNCPPAGGGPLLGLDVITLATVGAATTAAVVTIINLNKLNDLQDKVDNLASP